MRRRCWESVIKLFFIRSGSSTWMREGGLVLELRHPQPWRPQVKRTEGKLQSIAYSRYSLPESHSEYKGSGKTGCNVFASIEAAGFLSWPPGGESSNAHPSLSPLFFGSY